MALWISAGLLGFNYFGYIFVLFLLSKRKKLKPKQDLLKPRDRPFYLLVPTWNEGDLLTQKLKNISSLRYSYGTLNILILDGGSNDKSVDAIGPFLSAKIRLLKCPLRGKTQQLNFALNQIESDALVAISDVDALISGEDALDRAAEILAQAEVGVIGAWGAPNIAQALQMEIAFWDKQNRLRYLETKASSASIVTALFYAFPRLLIDKFPDDCVADDVYIACAAHSKNLKVVYTPTIEAIELRQPTNYLEFFKHKFRKAHAYTTEILRPLHRLPYLSSTRKFILVFKIYQFFYLPWATAIFLYASILHLMHSQYLNLFICYGGLFIGTFVASFMMQPPPGRTRGGLELASVIPTLFVFIIVNIVLISNSVLFPFWRQDSSFSRVGHR